MPTIFVKDDLRASVEAATGGQVTVLYSESGNPSYMVRVPKFNLQDIHASLGTGVHPAFIVNGIEKDEIFIGQYPGIAKNNNLISLPGTVISTSITYDAARNVCGNNGAGWHLMTHAEWAAIALWCWKNGTMPRGNNHYGQDYECPWESAPRLDGGVIGNASGGGKSYTGAGPASWRHNGQMSGIADLNGNVWEWAGGLRLQDGEIQILPNNDAADRTKDQSATSALWKAIKASDGSLVAPGTAGTLKYDATTEGGTGGAVLSDVITNRSGEIGDDSNAGGSTSTVIESLTAKTNLTVPAIAKVLCLYPVASSGLGGDRLYTRNHGERLPLAGGTYNYGSAAGVFARYLSNPRTLVSSHVGARPAYVL